MKRRTRIDQEKFDPAFVNQTLAELKAPIVGVDEVGRGCLAGPVVAGAVIFSAKPVPVGLTDSKLLSEKQRDQLFPQIIEHHHWGLGFASVEEIDAINIFQASLLAMRRALTELKKNISKHNLNIGFILVDGAFEIPGVTEDQAAVIKGDLRVPAIAAASIIAKVHRDRLMKEMDEVYPGFGFAKHKGYASAYHRQAIQKSGPCTEHRKTFKGVKEYVDVGAGR